MSDADETRAKTDDAETLDEEREEDVEEEKDVEPVEREADDDDDAVGDAPTDEAVFEAEASDETAGETTIDGDHAEEGDTDEADVTEVAPLPSSTERDDRKSVVVTGARGSYGRVVVPYLARQGYRVIALDRSPWPDVPRDVEFHQVNILKRGFDDVLRRSNATALIHLALIHRFSDTRASRYRVNFEGTARVIERAAAHGINHLVFGSRATVYGALPDQPEFVDEAHPPAAGRMFAEMQDLVDADLYASSALWRHPELELVILRFVNVLGPSVNTLLQRYLAGRRVFTVAGFDPLYQVLHERDMARALELALTPGLRGVFNVTGPGAVPLHVLIDETGATRVPIPEPLVRLLKGRLGFPNIPDGAIDFLKYSCTVDGTRFRDATGFEPEVGLRAACAARRAARRYVHRR